MRQTDAPSLKLPGVSIKVDRCPLHGVFEARALVEPGSNGSVGIYSACPQCESTRKAARTEHAEATALAERRSAIAKRFHDAAIPPRFNGCTFENFRASTDEQRHALRVVQSFAERFETVVKRGGSLTLTGPTGTGKTHLAAAALGAITESGATGLYRLADAAVRYLKASYSGGCGYTEDQALQHLRMPDLLVLDEVGNQHNSDDEKRVLFAILNARYAYMRPTLVVSNLTSDGLRQWAGQAFHDRLLEAGVVVPCQWESYRPQVGRKGGAA